MSIGGEEYRPFYDEMRRLHGYCGPYRLGIAVGKAGADLPNPYVQPISVKQFDAGRSVGNRLRDREEVEREIRVSIWNACREGGMDQDLAQSLVRRAMGQQLMRQAIARLAL